MVRFLHLNRKTDIVFRKYPLALLLVSRFFLVGLIYIAEYRAAAADFTETARQANLLIHSLDQLLTNQQSAKRLPEFTAAIGKIGQEVKGFADYVFYRALILCVAVIFSILLAFLIYRVVSVKWLTARHLQ